MESGNVAASLKGGLIPMRNTSDIFETSVLARLQSAHLYEESRQSFRYDSAVLIENALLEEKYNAFRAKKRRDGYSEEELKESYGFLLFDDVNKAHALGRNGVVTGNSTCTTLGDPLKGVYISMYSDCLDLNRWYNGTSGYIVIFRLTKGRVKSVFENDTQNLTPPTVGFDCHVSEELPSVSAKTSYHCAFERTQCYMYELLDDGTCETANSPSAACPFAIVSFSYTDTKATLHAPHEISEEKKLDFHYVAWMGQLQIGTQFIDVGLRSAAVALIPVKLPPVVKIDRAISMLELSQLLPRAAFETCLSGEVFLDGFYISLCELVPSATEENKLFSLLLQEIKEKHLALPVPLNDGGFLMLLHSSHFLTHNGSGSKATEVMQAMFVFPESRHIHRGTKPGQRKGTGSSKILQILPALNYAEGEVEKTLSCDSTEELSEVFVKHMQSYTSLIHPGLELSHSRQAGIFPDPYDFLPAHKHLNSSPEWTNKARHSLRTYVSKPGSFQLSLSKASEILAVEQDEQRYDLDDDAYIRPPSPEEAQTAFVCQTSMDHEKHVDLTVGPQNDRLDHLQPRDATSDSEKWTVLLKTDGKDPMTPAASDDLPAELIVSITSAERSVTDESLSLINTMSTMKHDDFQVSGISEAKLPTAELICLHDENVDIKSKDSPQATHFINAKPRKLRRGHSIGLKRPPKACSETLILQTTKKAGSISMRCKEDRARELSSPSNTHWKKLRRQRWKFGKLSSKNKIVRCASVGLRVAEKRKSSTIGLGQEMCPPRKKIEHWDLKPVVSECGRILVPHGSEVTVKIQSLKDQLRHKNNDPEKNLFDASASARNKVKMGKDSSTEAAVEDTETTTSRNEVSQTENVASCLNKEHILVTQSDNGPQPLSPKHGEHSSKADVIDCPPSKEFTKKDTKSTSPQKIALKDKLLFSKLKSVLLRGKRKACMSEGSKDSAANTEPCLKKGKGDSDAGVVKIIDEALSGQDNVVVKGVSQMLSVDPLFAYALGLTPIEKPEVQKSEGQDCQQWSVSSDTQEQTIVSTQQPQIIPSSLLKRHRTKMLKKHQGVSEDCLKKTWWLHFQTPACLDTEKLKSKEHAEDISVVKTVKENMNSACSSTDALNLLADLALGASNDLVPPQATFGRKSETNQKRCELTKEEVASAEQESVLHTLLRQPAAKPIQPLETSSSHLMGDKEMVDLISKEHNYSLPLSSPLVLGLSGTPFQVPPLSGSTRLLHHYQQLYGNHTEKVPPPVCQEDGGESAHWTQDSMKKHLERKTKFRHSRLFVNKYKSVEVTRQWKGKYDFHGDSKLASEPKGKSVMRALHGPWDFTIQDTTEDIRLIVHMWIGLFYSRSTPRLFHIDSNFPNLCPEESESLEMSTQTVPTPIRTELKPNALSSIADTQDNSVSDATYLSTKDNIVSDEGSAVLDLSLRNSDPHNQENAPFSCEEKETGGKLSTLKPSLRLQEASTLQCCTRADSTEINDDHRSHSEDDKTCIPSQKTGRSEDTGMPSLFILPQGKMRSLSNLTENDPAASGVGHDLHGFGKGKTCIKGDADILQTTEMTYVQHILDSSKHAKEQEYTTRGKEIDHTDDQTKEGVNCPEKENPCHEGKNELPAKVESCTGGGAANKDSFYIDGNTFEKERQEHKATMTQSENNVELWSGHEGKLIIDENAFGSDEIDVKDICIPAMETGNEKCDPPSPMLHGDPDSIDRGGPTDCSRQTLIHQQAPQVEDSWHDLNLGKSAVTDKYVISEKVPQIPCGKESVNKDAAVKETPEMDHCLNEGGHYQEVSGVADDSCSFLDGYCVTESFPLKRDCLETGSKNTVVQVNSGISSDDHEVEQTKSVVRQGTDDNAAQEKSFHRHSPPPQYEVIQKCEEALTKETSVKMDITNEQMGISSSMVVSPFSGGHVVHTTHQQDKTEDVKCQKEIPFISDDFNPNLLTEVGKTPDIYCTVEKLYSDRISPLNVIETNQQVVCETESDERCPTPTLDEKPLECIPSPRSDTKITKISENTSPRQLNMGSKPTEDKILAKQELCQKSRFDCDPSHYSQDTDLELRTLRVLQSVDEFLSTSNHLNNASQVETTIYKRSLEQNPNLKPIPAGLGSSHTSWNMKNENILYLQPVVVSASNSTFKTKLVEVVSGVQLELDKMDMSPPQDTFERTDKLRGSSTEQGISHFCRSSTEGLQANKANVPDRYKTSQSALSHESFSHIQRPIVAVKPSMSDESQADRITKDGHTEYPAVTYTTPLTMSLEESEDVMGNYKPNNKQESNKSSSRSSQTISSINANLVLQKNPLLDHSYQYKERNMTSSLSAQSRKSAKNHKSKNAEMKLKDCSKASTSDMAANDTSAIEDSLIKEPQTSLTCTVFNTDRKSSDSFLERVSKRCLQDDLTQASLEQEHLILSEKMKQLLKRKKTTTCQQDTHGHLNLSHSSPMTVCFSGLEDQEDLLVLIDAPSLAGQKLKVDMSNKTDMADSTKEKELPPEVDHLKELGGLSGVTAKCARSYEAMMDEVCSARKAQSTPKHLQNNRNNKNVEPSHHFDVCDQMKQRIDESFQSDLSSVVKKSGTTKYRFYILETSDDDLFEETKAQMESEGHSAVQPSEFFHGDNSSSSLLIIVRNEDIAEHISKVPHLLELKKTPGVQFAGIDEPDDVVNLTHQELFTQGGFIMFDRAALGDISLCNMKKCSEILHELSKKGKWKWMVHYRDSRQLKENARTSAEAKQKQFFLNSCRDAGILEVLPYHECDTMSRQQPNYLTCLVRLQVHNISARYPVFITDATTDGTFGKNGIFTLTVNSFLTKSSSETFLFSPEKKSNG